MKTGQVLFLVLAIAVAPLLVVVLKNVCLTWVVQKTRRILNAVQTIK